MTTRVGYQRHHIIEKRFKSAFYGATDSNMFSILIKTEDYQKITSKVRKHLPYGTTYTQAKIRQGMKLAYRELYNETGDNLYLFLSEFVTKAKPN